MKTKPKELCLDSQLGPNITIAKLMALMNEHNVPMSAELQVDVFDGGTLYLVWDDE